MSILKFLFFFLLGIAAILLLVFAVIGALVAFSLHKKVKYHLKLK